MQVRRHPLTTFILDMPGVFKPFGAYRQHDHHTVDYTGFILQEVLFNLTYSGSFAGTKSFQNTCAVHRSECYSSTFPRRMLWIGPVGELTGRSWLASRDRSQPVCPTHPTCKTVRSSTRHIRQSNIQDSQEQHGRQSRTAHIRQLGTDSGPSFRVKMIETFQVVRLAR